MSADGKRLIVGTRKGLVILEHEGRRWKTVAAAHAGIPVPYAIRDPRTDILWSSLDHGHWGQKLSRSTDGGASWTEVPQPTYPEGATIKDGVSATLRYLWVIEPGGADEPQRMYLGTEPGGLFVSDDGGDSFTLNPGLWNHPSRVEGQWFGGGRDEPGIHSVLVDPRDSSHLSVGVSCAGVFQSTDHGQSWTPTNQGLKADFLPDPDVAVGHDPHLLVHSTGNPDHQWQQNHCGIFRSTDGGTTWADVSEADGPASFGFAVAVDPQDGDTAWVVPAISDEKRMAIDGAVCVCRTTDGGRSWTALREGLPQEGAYDVVFRHGLDQRGDRLAFGSTSGNLYVSDDRGESWHTVSNNLAPIYSVRFA
jgi:photosystem II stability/assembly factor-like uncharacterized protein